jgi:hypothetical protein
MTEACQTISQKRKLQPDDPDDNGDDEVKGESSASNLAFSQRVLQPQRPMGKIALIQYFNSCQGH